MKADWDILAELGPVKEDPIVIAWKLISSNCETTVHLTLIKILFAHQLEKQNFT